MSIPFLLALAAHSTCAVPPAVIVPLLSTNVVAGAHVTATGLVEPEGSPPHYLNWNNIHGNSYFYYLVGRY